MQDSYRFQFRRCTVFPVLKRNSYAKICHPQAIYEGQGGAQGW